MAHECPDCGLICYCNGDIDDMLLDNDEDVVMCSHCDEDGYDPFDEPDEEEIP